MEVQKDILDQGVIKCKTCGEHYCSRCDRKELAVCNTCKETVCVDCINRGTGLCVDCYDKEINSKVYPKDSNSRQCVDCGHDFDSGEDYIICDDCGRLLCDDCYHGLDDRYLCEECYRNRMDAEIVEEQRIQNNTTSGNVNVRVETSSNIDNTQPGVVENTGWELEE